RGWQYCHPTLHSRPSSPVPRPNRRRVLTPMPTRRNFLSDISRLAAMSAIAPAGLRFAPSPRFQDDPFELGVASGDPLPDGAVIWTRLAPRPMEPEGGMPGIRTTVTWEVARDEGFSNVV